MLVAHTVGVIDMEGGFQKESDHGLPPRQTSKALKEGPMHAAMKDWEK